MFKKISLVFLIASVCVISSCNSKKVKPTGFLHTYDTLKQTDPDSERLFYEKSKFFPRKIADDAFYIIFFYHDKTTPTSR